MLVDLSASATRRELHDRHRLSPFAGRALRGRVVRTLVRGTTVFRRRPDRRVAPLGRLLTPTKGNPHERPAHHRRPVRVRRRLGGGRAEDVRGVRRRCCRSATRSSTCAGAASRPGSRSATCETNLSFENHTSHPAPGEILLYPGGFSETEILFPYGGTLLREHRRPARRQPLPDGHRGPRAAARARPPRCCGRAPRTWCSSAPEVTYSPAGAHDGRRATLAGLPSAPTSKGGSNDETSGTGHGGCARPGAGGMRRGRRRAACRAGQRPAAGGQEGRRPVGALRRRRRQHRPGHHLLPVRLPRRVRDAAAAVLVQARRRDQPRAGPCRGRAGDLRRRQDADDQDPLGREVQPAGGPRGHDRRRQVRDRARASPSRSTARTWARS